LQDIPAKTVREEKEFFKVNILFSSTAVFADFPTVATVSGTVFARFSRNRWKTWESCENRLKTKWELL